jgi:tubulin-specific chaperone B
MFLEPDRPIKINCTHSHTKTVLAEQRFHLSTKLYEVKVALSKKFGTLPEYMKLKLIKKNCDPIFLSEDELCLAYYKVEDHDTIHVTDSNPNSLLVQNDFDDISTVKKYEISEEDYNKRNDSVRRFRKKLGQDPEYIKMINENKGNTYENEAEKIEVGLRCLLGDGFRRGLVMFVGLVPSLGYGFYVGVKLDEPTGDSDGIVKGKKVFDCDKNYGIFVRPDNVKTGDFPPLDLFNEEEDEI